MALGRSTQFPNDFLTKLHLSFELLDTLLELAVFYAKMRDVIVLIGDLMNQRSHVTGVILDWDFVKLYLTRLFNWFRLRWPAKIIKYSAKKKEPPKIIFTNIILMEF